MRIYLAGKISRNDWRHALVNGGMGVDASNAGEPWQEVALLGTRHVIVGPWFISCDHGCAHGPGSHGVGALGESSCVEAYPLDPDRRPDEQANRREVAVSRCLYAISRCDLFFAWLEPTAYGTVAELGYAKACGKRVVVGIPEAQDTDAADDLWFPRFLADDVVHARDPVVALRHFLDRENDLSEERCESPLELAMLSAIRRRNPRLFGFRAINQYPVAAYRLDFALLGEDGRKVAVEVDGHDFHERTKEQAQRDKERDRFLTLNGWRVLRFTGREVHRDAARCAQQIVELLGQ